MEMLSFIRENFTHVAPLLIAAGFAIIICVDRVYALMWKYPLQSSDAFFDKIRSLIMSDRIGEATLLCERYRSKPVAQVVKEGLLRAHQPENLIEHGLQIAVGEQTDRIQARTSFLATIANVATLLGLFGTILGLIASFNAVGNANPQQRATLLAQGISSAMNATMIGLGVAIPCMVAYAFLMNKTNRLNSVVERSAVRVLDLLKQRYYTAEHIQDPLVTKSGLESHGDRGTAGRGHSPSTATSQAAAQQAAAQRNLKR